MTLVQALLGLDAGELELSPVVRVDGELEIRVDLGDLAENLLRLGLLSVDPRGRRGRRGTQDECCYCRKKNEDTNDLTLRRSDQYLPSRDLLGALGGAGAVTRGGCYQPSRTHCN